MLTCKIANEILKTGNSRTLEEDTSSAGGGGEEREKRRGKEKHLRITLRSTWGERREKGEKEKQKKVRMGEGRVVCSLFPIQIFEERIF